MNRIHTVLSSACIALSALCAGAADVVREHPVIEGFRNPPRECALQCWWHWLDDCVTREGIARDLKAMAEAGLSTAHIFAPRMSNLTPTAKTMSPEWLSLFEYAIAEAKKNGIRLGFHNCPGWSSSGGPWIRPEDSMKVVCASAYDVNVKEADGQRELKLPDLPSNRDFVRELAVYAFPIEETPRLAGGTIPSVVPLRTKDRVDVELTYAEDFVPRMAALDLPLGSFYADVEVSAQIDGVWRSRGKQAFRCFRAGEAVRTFALFGDRPAKKWKWTFTAVPSPPWVPRRDLPVKSLALGNWPFEEGGSAVIAAKDLVAVDGAVKDGVLDLVAFRRLIAGRKGTSWRILRLGYTTTGVGPSPSTTGGLECDKLSRKGIEVHWQNMPARILSLPGAKETVCGVIVDSYEAGGQNWTEDLPAEFKNRMGYEIGGFLVSLAGYAYDSRERTRNFRNEMKNVVADLIAENYYDRFADLCHEAGVKAITEPYGGPFETERAARKSDVLTTEFWLGSPLGWQVDRVVKAARKNGRNVIAAEAFTTDAKEGRWQATPDELKRSGDTAWMAGINQLVYHSYVHQPFVDHQPGTSLGRHGSQLNVNTTWWPEMRAWTDYVRRGQFLLQYGVQDRERVLIADGRLETFIRRGPVGERVWFVRNVSSSAIDEFLKLSAKPNDPGCELNAVDGTVVAADSNDELTRVCLEPGESRFFAFKVGSVRERKQEAGGMIADLSMGWRIDSFDGLAPLPAPRPVKDLELWNESEDELLQYFAGRARYCREGAFPAGILDLGEVYDLANVFVDGKPIGTVWTNPHRLAVPAGRKLEIEVVNVWPNRLIGDAVREKRGEKINTWSNWRGWTADEPLRKAGLKGPVRLLSTIDGNHASVTLRPDRAGSVYQTNETAQLLVSATDRKGRVLRTGRVTVRAEGTDWTRRGFDLAEGNPFQLRVSRTTPGFVHLSASVSDSEAEFKTGVAFAPEKIHRMVSGKTESANAFRWTLVPPSSKTVLPCPLRIVFDRTVAQTERGDEWSLDVTRATDGKGTGTLPDLVRVVGDLIERKKCTAEAVTCSGTGAGAASALELMAEGNLVTRGVLYAPQFGPKALDLARRVKCPVRFVVGFADCIPFAEAACAVYNACASTDKRFLGAADMGACVLPGFVELMEVWERTGARRSEDCRLLAFNIWGEYFRNPAKERAKTEAAVIAGWNPDLVALQEVTSGFWSSALMTELRKEYEIVGEKGGPGGSTCCVALAYRRSRFAVVASDSELLCAELDPSKALVWAVVEERATKKRILAFATHLWWKNGLSEDWIRLQNAKQIVVRLRDLSSRYQAAIVGGGDINAPIESWAMRHFLQNGLADAQLTADLSPRYVPTNHREPWRDAKGRYFGLPAVRGVAPKTSTIDHIFYQSDRISAIRFDIDVSTEACAVSDHHPIVLDFRIH